MDLLLEELEKALTVIKQEAEELTHKCDELKKENRLLFLDSCVYGQSWAYLCGKLTAIEGRNYFPEVVPAKLQRYYTQGYNEAKNARDKA